MQKNKMSFLKADKFFSDNFTYRCIKLIPTFEYLSYPGICFIDLSIKAISHFVPHFLIIAFNFLVLLFIATSYFHISSHKREYQKFKSDYL